ncbi:hypothetical protein [Candidatus Sororendozoicomonas aggregata]|uniref:hypothetical protein n=1 Tax=Candidatus Sororendozoicomonas aggregata TaxID=3073239 RepID=UPI002ED14E93
MQYGLPSKANAIKSFKTILSGLAGSENMEGLNQYRRWLTDTAHTPSFVDKLLSLGHCLPISWSVSHFGDESTQRRFNNIKNSGESVKQISKKRQDCMHFGLFNKKNKRIGFLIEDLKKDSDKRELANKLIEEEKDHPWFLKELTKKEYMEDQEQWLIEGDFFLGYMQTNFSLIDYIASTVKINKSDDLTYIISSTAFMIFGEDFLIENTSEKTRELERLLYHIAKDNGFKKVIYRNSDMARTLSFDVADAKSDITKTLSPDGADDKPDRVMTILNPFPLKNSSFLLLMQLSKFDVVGCTGDQSFYEAINTGKIPLHENVPHLFKFHKKLSKEAKKLGLNTLANFFKTLRADEKSEYLNSIEIKAEWDTFRNHLFKNHNATNYLTEWFGQ